MNNLPDNGAQRNRQPDRQAPTPLEQGGKASGGQSSNPSASIPNFNDRIAAPSINLPKGGGAIQGIGEKFQMSPVTGTGSMSVPIAISPGRSGFAPALGLSYDSGSGNSPFGLGWNVGVPAITRKTQQGLPRYRDASESDTFILSGAEDLVPELDANGVRLQRQEGNVRVYRYRPRIEGLFARIERWVAPDGISHWRSISKENITTVYGESEESRITDPNDPRKIFQWNIERSFDDKGNVIEYRYKIEDGEGILNSIYELNRNNTNAYAQTYLKSIRYGNIEPYNSSSWSQNQWLFELMFDFGEHTATDADTNPPTYATQRPWQVRPDIFSSFRSSFDIRTYRLCRRVLMFHHVEPNGDVIPHTIDSEGNLISQGTPFLVKSTDLIHSESELDSSRIATQLLSVRHRSFDGTASASLPPVEFTYSAAVLDPTIRHLDAESLENLPVGIDNSAYQFVDLEGEGLSGVLSQYPEAWYYKRNLGDGHFGAKELVNARPSLAQVGNPTQQLSDLDGDGRLNLVIHGNGINGFYELDDEGRWDYFLSFPETPNVNWGDPNLRFIDLDGDGHADILITENDCLVWYASKAKEGYADLERVAQFLDEEDGPRLVFNDGTQTIFLADMVGDGLTDLVRIRNGEVCYWANMGYGHFSPKITMSNAPLFDHPEQFDPGRIRLADIDGSGTTDILYLDKDLIRYWFNQSGNSWVRGHEITSFPKTDNLSQVQVLDLLGKGTACLVWSSPLPHEGYSPVRYIDLMAGTLIETGTEAGRRINCKPYLLTEVRNNMGAITRLRYEPSTKFYLEDRRNGTPWITKLPFPVQVLCRVETFDDISKNAFISRYAYHHGYFDGVEREFRGFGMVEQWDTEDFSLIERDDNYQPLGSNWSEETDVPPVHTKTWFHTGFYRRRRTISEYFRTEYFQGDAAAWQLEDTILDASWSLEEAREAARALKGSALRQEVFAQDPVTLVEEIYTVAENSYNIQRLQPKDENEHAVFLVTPAESLTYHYERNPEDPRIAHQLTLEVDGFGNVTKSAAVVYPRRSGMGALSEQTRWHITYSESQFINRDLPGFRRIGVGWMQKTFEVGLSSDLLQNLQDPLLLNNNFVRPFAAIELSSQNDDGFIDIAEPLSFHNELSPSTNHQKRLLNCALISFYNPGLTAELPFGEVAAHALPFRAYQAAFTQAMLDSQNDWFEGRVAATLLQNPEAGYLPIGAFNFFGTPNLAGLEGTFWSQSGRLEFDPAHFFLPLQQIDPFGHPTEFRFDDHSLLLRRSYTEINGVTLETVADNNYRLLQPHRVTDPNDNVSEVMFDTLGMVAMTVVRDNAGNGDLMPAVLPPFDPATLYTTMDVRELEARTLLGTATSRLVYNLFAYWDSRNSENPQPNYVHVMTRERHLSDPGGDNPRLQQVLSYSDGFGREILTKVQAEHGEAPAYDVSADGQRTLRLTPDRTDVVKWITGTGEAANFHRWVGNGRTIFNNKGLPVRQYEPFFDSHPFFTEEDLLRLAGVSPEIIYDPLGRVIRTNFPEGTHSRVEFTPWMQRSFDQNDTVLEEGNRWYAEHGSPDPATPMPTDIGQRAAWLAAQHADTPTQTHLDTLGRPFLTIAHNRYRYSNGDTGEVFIPTRTVFDIIGNPLEIWDGRNSAGRTEAQVMGILQNGPDLIGNPVVNYRYAMNGAQIFQHSMDAGDRWSLTNVAGNPIRLWDGMGRMHETRYDALQRPTHQWVRNDETSTPLLVERMIYGEDSTLDEALKLRGQPYLHFDGAGLVRNEAFDFKGNPLQTSRRLSRVPYQDHRNPAPVWQDVVRTWEVVDGADANTAEALAANLLETETFTVSTRYDALNRPRRVQNHHDGSVQYPLFNEAGLLDMLRVNLHSSTIVAVADEMEDGIRNHGSLRTFIENIDYDVKGQRERIRYGNGVTTKFEYDDKTFRLLQLRTTRHDTPIAAEQRPIFQELNYTYDPVGNITSMLDNAQQDVYFDNGVAEPHAHYAYDALYQLIEATGREQSGQTHDSPPNHEEIFLFNGFPVTNETLRNYTEQYHYDPAGNITRMRHLSPESSERWTRHYHYNPLNNQLNGTNRTNSPLEPYHYDAHGNMISMPHLRRMTWDYKDQLIHVNTAANVHAFYSYDSQRQRVRKVVFHDDQRTERIYLGGFEIFRRTSTDGTVVNDELQTLHIMDDKQRVCMVETITVTGSQPIPPDRYDPRYRYQLSNHLGSSMAELDEQAQVITYEEYHPYGSTSFRASRSGAEVSEKRYRYTGMERDEETGLGYHGARYYVGWLGRWCNCDPGGLNDGLNLFLNCHNNPIISTDKSGFQTDVVSFEEEKVIATVEIGVVGVKKGDTFESLAGQAFKKHFGDKLSEEALNSIVSNYIKSIKTIYGIENLDLLLNGHEKYSFHVTLADYLKVAEANNINLESDYESVLGIYEGEGSTNFGNISKIAEVVTTALGLIDTISDFIAPIKSLSKSGIKASLSEGRAILLNLLEKFIRKRAKKEVAEEVLQRGFPYGFRNIEEFIDFSDTMNKGLGKKKLRDVEAYFQGSSVTGVGYDSAKSFDFGRVSDFDIALSSKTLLDKAKRLGIPLDSNPLRSMVLSDDHLRSLGLLDLRNKLSREAGRQVNLKLFGNRNAVFQTGPSFPVPR